MSKPKNRVKTTRHNFMFTGKMLATLKLMKDNTEAASVTEVLRRAVATYEFLLFEKRRGCRLVSEDLSDGSKKEVVLL